MPGVRPQLPNSESYLCTGASVPSQETLYIRGRDILLLQEMLCTSEVYRGSVPYQKHYISQLGILYPYQEHYVSEVGILYPNMNTMH